MTFTDETSVRYRSGLHEPTEMVRKADESPLMNVRLPILSFMNHRPSAVLRTGRPKEQLDRMILIVPILVRATSGERKKSGRTVECQESVSRRKRLEATLKKIN